MKNFIQEGENINIVATGAVVSGVPELFGKKVVIPVTDAASGETYAAMTKGVFELDKVTGVITAGDQLFWDVSELEVTATAQGNTFIGYAAETVASGAATIKVILVDAPQMAANVAIPTGTDAAAGIAGVNAILLALKRAGLMIADA